MKLRFLNFSVIFFILCTFYSKKIAAQKNWQPITIIKVNGDTIHGEFLFKNKFKSFKSLSVRDEKSKAKLFYLPQDVHSFIIKLSEQELYFKTFQIEADYSSNDPSHISDTPTITLVNDTVFAQLLISGTKKVYCFKDNIGFKTHYLIETREGHAIDLIDKSYFLDEGRTRIGHNERYKKQLMEELSNSSIVTPDKINAVPFTKEAILKTIKDYNLQTSSSDTMLYEYKNEKVKFQYGITAGANITTIHFNFGLKDYNQLHFDPSYGFNAGLHLNIIIPQTRKRFSIYNDLLFSNYAFKSTTSFIKYEQRYWQDTYLDANINVSTLKLVTALRFQMPQRLAPFFQLGIVNGFVIKSSNVANIESHFESTITYENRPFLDFRGYEQSLFAGAGIRYKKIGLEFRYERGNGIAQSLTGGGYTTYYYILWSYRL